jgi:hypothetical protein
VGLTILIESGVLLGARTRTPEPELRLQYRSHQGPVMERKSDMHQERQWELYRLSVAEKMPDSEYKTAVLAGIAHALMRLDSIEASRWHSNDDPASSRSDRNRGLRRTATARNGWNGSL